MRADASAASVPAWPPPTTMTSNRLGNNMRKCLEDCDTTKFGIIRQRSTCREAWRFTWNNDFEAPRETRQLIGWRATRFPDRELDRRLPRLRDSARDRFEQRFGAAKPDLRGQHSHGGQGRHGVARERSVTEADNGEFSRDRHATDRALAYRRQSFFIAAAYDGRWRGPHVEQLLHGGSCAI